jgi:hypothetical protein
MFQMVSRTTIERCDTLPFHTTLSNLCLCLLMQRRNIFLHEWLAPAKGYLAQLRTERPVSMTWLTGQHNEKFIPKRLVVTRRGRRKSRLESRWSQWTTNPIVANVPCQSRAFSGQRPIEEWETSLLCYRSSLFRQRREVDFSLLFSLSVDQRGLLF